MGGQRRWLGAMGGQWRIGVPIVAVVLACFAYLWASGTIGFGWLSTAVSWVLNADPDKSPYRNSKDFVILGGTLVTLHFAFRRVKAAEKQNKNQTKAIRAQTEQLRLNEIQMELTRRDQLSKRFTEAVKQLGDDKLAIRMGGIAGLWAVATESTHAEDRIMVLDVLCAFVRNAPRPEESEEQKIKPDVELAMSRLGSKGAFFPWEETNSIHNVPYKKDLRGGFFSGFILSGDFSYADFSKCCFKKSDLRGCYFNYSNFSGVKFTDLNFSLCVFNFSDFSRSVVSKVNFDKCEFINVIFNRVSFENVKFEESNINFSFSNSKLSSINVRDSYVENFSIHADLMCDISFSRSVLRGIIHSGCDIDHFEFTSCDMVDLKIYRRVLSHGIFSQCDLTRTSFGGSTLLGVEFEDCVYREGCPPSGLRLETIDGICIRQPDQPRVNAVRKPHVFMRP